MTPNNEAIAVSVNITSGIHVLRFHILDSHLKLINNPERLDIRGQAAKGFVIVPSKTGRKINKNGLRSGGYLQSTLSHFDLSKTTRRRIEVQPQIKSGEIILPPMPPDWIAGTPESIPETTSTKDVIRSGVANMMAPVRNGEVFNGSVTSPLPKPATPSYVIPSDTTMAEMQAQLAARLNDARTIIKSMEDRTGMKFVLDRNLRLVVALS